jgi:hypothetical protein
VAAGGADGDVAHELVVYARVIVDRLVPSLVVLDDVEGGLVVVVGGHRDAVGQLIVVVQVYLKDPRVQRAGVVVGGPAEPVALKGKVAVVEDDLDAGQLRALLRLGDCVLDQGVERIRQLVELCAQLLRQPLALRPEKSCSSCPRRQRNGCSP